MRISDWSSDVCSSDLRGDNAFRAQCPAGKVVGETRAEQWQRVAEGGAAVIFVGLARHPEVGVIADRKSVVEGKSVSVRVDLGGRRIIKKKKKKQMTRKQNHDTN